MSRWWHAESEASCRIANRARSATEGRYCADDTGGSSLHSSAPQPAALGLGLGLGLALGLGLGLGLGPRLG